MTSPALCELSDDVLHCEVKRLAGRANTLLAELLAHLGELEARGIHRERACSSLYAYCVYELRMSEDEAQRRCRAARLARQFPLLLAMLAEASLHLTGILLIGPHLTLENHQQLLSRVRFRTKREIERFVAELAPAADAPARIEPLHDVLPDSNSRVDAVAPTRTRTTWAADVRALTGPIRALQAGTGAGQAPPVALPESSVDVSARSCGGSNTASIPAPPLAAQSPPANSGPRYRIQFTADQAFVDLLEEARDLLQHAVSDRNFVEVQRRALQALVKKLRAKRCAASDRPRASKPPSPAGPPAPTRAEHTLTTSAAQQSAPNECTAPERRHIAAVVRRSVWQRDAARCSYTDLRGQRCRERAGLELHHLQPHTRGGPASVENLALRCRAHNALAAEQDLGREWLRRKTRARRAGAGRRPL